MDPQRVVDLVLQLEDEVNNGGFHQFFNNSSGDDTSQTIEALETIGATAAAEILIRAASKFPGNMPPSDRDERLELLWRECPAGNEFWDLDQEFFNYPQDLSALIVDYKSRLRDSFPA